MNIHPPALITAAALAALTISCATHARVGVYADVPGPPSLAFETEPYLVPLPGTYAYGIPDYDVDLYYADGYYWRPWEGRWYRSAQYNGGWVSFSGVPGFYTSVPRGWRDDYRSNRWRGNSWDYARVPRHEVERNWSSWKRERRWDDDQSRYTGDRRWHDGDGRQSDHRDREGRDSDRRAGEQDQDRRYSDRRETSGPGVQAPERRDVDGRVYETREVEQRRVYDGRQQVERREVEPRNVERREVEPRNVERREVERRPVEGRNVNPGTREMERRPVVQERRTIEQQQVAPGVRGKGEGRDVTPRGRGPVGKDENRDGIDDSLQRPR